MIDEETLSNLIDEWQDSTTDLELHEWLGLTREQYGSVVNSDRRLTAVAMSRGELAAELRRLRDENAALSLLAEKNAPSTHYRDQWRALFDAPRPWRVQHDWTWEVVTADGKTVDKFSDEESAQALCDRANAARVYVPGFGDFGKER